MVVLFVNLKLGSLETDTRRTVWPRVAFDWSEHFSLEGPAVSTVSLRASLSLSWTQAAVMNEEEAGGIQEHGWQSPVSQRHTAGQGQKNESHLGRPTGRRGLINGARFGPNTQLAHLTKYSVSPLPFFLAWFNVCLQHTGGGGERAAFDHYQGQEKVLKLFYHQVWSVKLNKMRLSILHSERCHILYIIGNTHSF